MLEQASEAITSAYADGLSRQWVRLRLDLVSLPERLSDQWQWDAQAGWRQLPLPPGGLPVLHEATLPLAEKLASSIVPGGSEVKRLRTALIDEEDSADIGTLLYREAADSADDLAVLFLVGRTFAVADGTPDFLRGMKQRLVVMLNSEDAASTFKVENRGQDFAFTSEMFKVGAANDFCETFEAQTYHFSSCSVNGWKLVIFRAYPHPWDIFIQDLQDQLVKLREVDAKPSNEDLAQWTAEYEEAKAISPLEKRERALRDGAKL